MKAFLGLSACVLAVIAVAVAALGATSDGLAAPIRSGWSGVAPIMPRSVPPLTAAMYHSINGAENAWKISAAPAGTPTPVTKSRAVVTAAADHAFGTALPVIGAGLVRWTARDPAHSRFVWAVFFNPRGLLQPGPAAGAGVGPPVDYAVVFVDGSTGKLLASGDGYTPPSPT